MNTCRNSRHPLGGILVVLLAVTLVCSSSAYAQERPQQPNRLTVSTATYLGDWEGNSPGGVAVTPEGEVVVVGRIPKGHEPGDVGPIELEGGGEGAVVRFNGAGTEVLSVTRVGSNVRDVDVDDAGRIAVAVEGAGVVVLDAEARQVLWEDADAPAVRVAAGSQGRVAALGSDKRIRIYAGNGEVLGTRRFGDNYVTDIALDDERGIVFVTGFNNKRLRMRNGRRGPVQVAFIRAFDMDDLSGSPRWINYDWPGDPLGAAPPDADKSDYHLLEADTRGYRLAMGRDGMLYFAGEAAGGNAIYSKDPRDLDRDLVVGEELIRIDGHTHPYNTGANHVTIFARFEPDTGKLDRLQWALSRLENTRGNTIRPRGIAADADGRAYVVGVATAHIANRGDIWINDTLVHPENASGAFLLVTSPDWHSRDTWVVFGKGTCVGVDVREGHYALVAETRGSMVTTDNALYGHTDDTPESNAYLVVDTPAGD
ncbi:MAG: hypothetical protein ACP5HU_02490 [Phycisphaerae bacterium]